MDGALVRHDALITAAVVDAWRRRPEAQGRGRQHVLGVRAPHQRRPPQPTEAQRQLTEEPWPEATQIVVRMGDPHWRGCPARPRLLRADGQPGGPRARARRRRPSAAHQCLCRARGGRAFLKAPSSRFLRSELLRGTDRLEAIHELVDHPPRAARGMAPAFRRATFTPPRSPRPSRCPRVFVGRARPLRAHPRGPRSCRGHGSSRDRAARRGTGRGQVEHRSGRRPRRARRRTGQSSSAPATST